MYKEIKGDLIELALKGEFDIIAHGCNCFCQMGAGIAPQMAKSFGCNNYLMEGSAYKGDINKLGTIDGQKRSVNISYPGQLSVLPKSKIITIINAYTQYEYNAKTKPLNYEALTLCLKKINYLFAGSHIGLPQIGAGLAGGDWNKIKSIIQKELVDCNVTIVIYNK